jgi:hypothetical protein
MPKKLDFRRGAADGESVDTGGMNWESLYSRLERKTMKFPCHEYRSIRNTNGSAQSDRVEFISDWLHIFNASGWMLIPDPEERERLINAMIKDL